MRKMETVAGGCIALLAIVSIGQLYLDRQANPSQEKSVTKEIVTNEEQAPAKNETVAVTVDEVVATYLPSLKDGTPVGRQVALGSLLDELEGPEYGKARLKKRTVDELAEAAIKVAEDSDAESQPPAELKTRVAGFLAGRTHGAASHDYALKVLDSGSAEEKAAVLDGIMTGRGIGGAKVFGKISEMGASGLISGEMLPGLLWRTGGKKSVEAITALMKSTASTQVISACVIALQNAGDASVIGPSLERLEAVGMTTKPKVMPWISASMFATFMETAEGSTLSRGIKLMNTRPSLVKRSLPAVEKGLAKGDAQTRRDAADAVKKAVIAKYIDAKRGEELLAGRLEIETEPVLKAELTGGLKQVQELIGDPKTPESKPQ